MKGYKAFNPDLTCRGMQYEIGKSYSMDEEPVLCEWGFHFCETIHDCSLFYKLLGTDNRVCEVEASGTIKHKNDKCVTNQLFIVRELSRSEINRGLYLYADSNGGGNGCGYGYAFRLSAVDGAGDGGCWLGDGFGNGIDNGYGDGEGCGFGCGKCGSYVGSNGGGFGDGDGEGNGNGDGDGDDNGAITRILNFK